MVDWENWLNLLKSLQARVHEWAMANVEKKIDWTLACQKINKQGRKKTTHHQHKYRSYSNTPRHIGGGKQGYIGGDLIDTSTYFRW